MLGIDELLPGAGTGPGVAGEPRLRTRLHRGDDVEGFRLAQQAAGATATATPLGAAAANLYQLFVDRGAGVLDFSGIYRLIGKSDGKI